MLHLKLNTTFKTCNYSRLKQYRSDTRNATRVLHTCDRKYDTLKNSEAIRRANPSYTIVYPSHGIIDCRLLPRSRRL